MSCWVVGMPESPPLLHSSVIPNCQSNPTLRIAAIQARSRRQTEGTSVIVSVSVISSAELSFPRSRANLEKQRERRKGFEAETE